MKHILIFLCVIVTTFGAILSNQAIAATCTTTAPGVWDCGTPTGADDLIVNHDVTITGGFTLTGSIIVNAGATLTFTSTFDADDNSTITISGTMDVADNMRLLLNAVITVTSTGILNAMGDLRIGSGGGSATINVDAGGVANVSGNFRMDGSATGTVDGTLDVSGSFRLDGSICGTGDITYGSCSGSGDACGDSGWCDGSGVITSGTLPVELLWFKALRNRSYIDLSWMTASELNNDFFEVGVSPDGENYTILAIIQGQGTTTKITVYNYTDRFPASGLNYYRLRQVDFNGDFAYSNIISVMIDTPAKLYYSAYPQPASSYLTLQFMAIDDFNVMNLVIYDLKGQLIKQMRIDPKTKQLPLDISNYTSGMYIIRLHQGAQAFHCRLLIQK